MCGDGVGVVCDFCFVFGYVGDVFGGFVGVCVLVLCVGLCGGELFVCGGLCIV